MSNKTTKELVKEARYLGITGFSRLKKYELEKAIRDANTKEQIQVTKHARHVFVSNISSG